VGLNAIEELKQAKENREAECGIFVFSKECAPVELGDFKIDGNDFYCTVIEDALEQNQPLLFFEYADVTIGKGRPTLLWVSVAMGELMKSYKDGSKLEKDSP